MAWSVSCDSDEIEVYSEGVLKGNYFLVSGGTCSTCSYPLSKEGTCPRPETHSIYVSKSYTIGLYYPLRKLKETQQSDFLSMHIYQGKNHMKYQKPLGLAIAELMKNRHKELLRFQALVPVPQHREKKRVDAETGLPFNQAVQLIRSISSTVSIPTCETALVRMRDQSMQGTVEQRRKAVEGLYTCDTKAIKDKRILLVDDVSTSGSTLAACAEQMITNGAKEVRAFTCGITFMD